MEFKLILFTILTVANSALITADFNMVYGKLNIPKPSQQCIFYGGKTVIQWCYSSHNETNAVIFDSKSFIRAALEPNVTFDLITSIELPSGLQQNQMSVREYDDDSLSIIYLQNLTQKSIVYSRDNKTQTFKQRQQNFDQPVTLLQLWGSYKFQLYDTADSGTQKISIFRYVDGVESTYPVSLFTQSGLIPFYFDINSNTNDTLLYLLTEQNIVNEHYIDFNTYKSNDTQKSIRLNNTCNGIKVVGSLLLISCNQTKVILDRADLSTVVTLDTNQAQFLTKSMGVQTLIFYADENQIFVQSIVYSGQRKMLLGPQTLLAQADDRVQLVDLDSMLGIVTKKNATQVYLLPVCMLDQFLKTNSTCGSCGAGSYSLRFDSKKCYACADLNSSLPNEQDYQTLKFYCENQIGQISGAADAALSSEISEDTIFVISSGQNLAQKDVENDPYKVVWVSVLTVCLSIGFVVPWVFLILWWIKKRRLLAEIRKKKNLKELQMLEISEEGSRIRLELIGSNGEQFNEAFLREQKFQKVSLLARQRLFNQAEDHKKNTCAICVEDFVIGDQVRETQCHHVFHNHCLMMWAQSKLWANLHRIGVPNCPNCNASLLDYKKSQVNKVHQSPPVDKSDAVSQPSDTSSQPSDFNTRQQILQPLSQRSQQEQEHSSEDYQLRVTGRKRVVLDVRGQESEAYYTINEQPMEANIEMQGEYQRPAQRWIVNTVSAGEEGTVSQKRFVLNSSREEIKTHLESAGPHERTQQNVQLSSKLIKDGITPTESRYGVPTEKLQVIPRNQAKNLQQTFGKNFVMLSDDDGSFNREPIVRQNSPDLKQPQIETVDPSRISTPAVNRSIIQIRETPRHQTFFGQE